MTGETLTCGIVYVILIQIAGGLTSPILVETCATICA